MHPFIHVVWRDIPAYGLCMVIAGFVMWPIILLLTKKRRPDLPDVSTVYLIGVCGALIGALSLRPIMKMVEVAVKWDYYSTITAGALFRYVFGEMVFYGGLIGGLAAVFIYCRNYKIKTVDMLDSFAPAIALGHAIGRMGCFFGGCCYGMEVPHDHPLAIVYPPASLGAPPGVPLLAVPLIEAAFLFLLFVTLSITYLKTKKRAICISLYLTLYSVERFILEFYRGDLIRGRYGFLTTSQYISIAAFIFGVLIFALAGRRQKRETPDIIE